MYARPPIQAKQVIESDEEEDEAAQVVELEEDEDDEPIAKGKAAAKKTRDDGGRKSSGGARGLLAPGCSELMQYSLFRRHSGSPVPQVNNVRRCCVPPGQAERGQAGGRLGQAHRAAGPGVGGTTGL